MRIAVDLTPVLPESQSGGVKLLVIGLLQDLIAAAPQVDFVLLTAPTTDPDLASLDGANVTRVSIEQSVQGAHHATPPSSAQVPFRRRVRLALTRALPPRLMLRIEQAYLAITRQRAASRPLPVALGASLLFSPLTTSSFREPGLPLVSLVHDVQFLHYPRFFRPDQRAARRRELQQAARVSDRLVCTSTYVQRTILENLDVPPARVVTIQPRSSRHLSRVGPEQVEQVLASFGLVRDEFLLYPAGFRPHKNHGMLLTAFGIFRALHSESELRLVCTGEKGPAFDELLHTTRVMGLQDRALFPGYVSEAELAALYQACRAVIFPSLDEGLALPVIEAMAFQKPVFCGRYPSLQDVAGDAAMYFNPRLLSEVTEAIELAARDAGLLQRLARAGAAAPATSDDAARAARGYLSLFCKVAA